MRDKLFWFTMTLVFLKGVIWAAFVPLWHFPDEQAHFAQVSYLGELFHYPTQFIGEARDLSLEILTSERLLGTERENGINKFTYHPEYRIEYTNSTVGKYEQEIVNLPIESRTNYVKYEAANYPALYYLSLTMPYRFLYEHDLLSRVFVTRIGNLIYSILFALIVWKIATILFRKRFFHAGLTIFVSFHPMFSFVSSGILSDNAINLWYAAFLLGGLTLLYRPFRWRVFLFVVGLLFLGPFVKQQSLFALPAFFGVCVYLARGYFRNRLVAFGIVAALLLLVPVAIFFSNAIRAYLALPLEGIERLFYEQLWFLRWSVEQTVRQIFPWYWGVFNWLGVTLPRETNRILIRLVGLALFGLVVYIIRRIRYGEFLKWDKAILFLFSVSVVYYFGILFWDFRFFLQYNYSFGIQGRYFFPTIIAHMILLVWGFRALIPQRLEKYWPMVFFGLVVGMIGLQFHALSTVLSSYYSFESPMTFLLQASQYKPAFFKYPYLLWWVGVYCLVLVVTLRLLAVEVLVAVRQIKVSASHRAKQ